MKRPWGFVHLSHDGVVVNNISGVWLHPHHGNEGESVYLGFTTAEAVDELEAIGKTTIADEIRGKYLWGKDS